MSEKANNAVFTFSHKGSIASNPEDQSAIDFMDGFSSGSLQSNESQENIRPVTTIFNLPTEGEHSHDFAAIESVEQHHDESNASANGETAAQIYVPIEVKANNYTAEHPEMPTSVESPIESERPLEHESSNVKEVESVDEITNTHEEAIIRMDLLKTQNINGNREFAKRVALHQQLPEKNYSDDDPMQDQLQSLLMLNGDFGRNAILDKEAKLDYTCCNGLPPCLPNEIELVIHNFMDVLKLSGQEWGSECKEVKGFYRWSLMAKYELGKGENPTSYLGGFCQTLTPKGLDDRCWFFADSSYYIAVINWNDWRESIFLSDNYNFHYESTDRGWPRMLVVQGTAEWKKKWLGPENQLLLRCGVFWRGAETFRKTTNFSRGDTGMLGLKNLGATCYMNSLIQAFYSLGSFKKAVYMMTKEEDHMALEDMNNRIIDKMDDNELKQLLQEKPNTGLEIKTCSRALQKLFFLLESVDEPVSAEELVLSFNWNMEDTFIQHDVQELTRLLSDKLDEQMKGTPSDHTIQTMFQGEYEVYIECIDVEFKSSRIESFQDLQLDVEKIPTLEKSLEKYVEEEILDGDNMYHADGHGKQRARKGIRFKRFPPVIQFHLKRFKFDLLKMDLAKLHSKFDFSLTLDLEPYCPNSGLYDLHVVMVHAGDVHGGHYYNFVRQNNKWVKFDDEKVYYVSEYAATYDNYGGCDAKPLNYFKSGKFHTSRVPSDAQIKQYYNGPESTYGETDRLEWTSVKSYSAYMLWYVQRSKSSEILCSYKPTVNPVMVTLLEEEIIRRKRIHKLKQELENRVTVNFLTEETMLGITGLWTSYKDIPVRITYTYKSDMTTHDFWQDVHKMYVEDQTFGKPDMNPIGIWYFDNTHGDMRLAPLPSSRNKIRRILIGDLLLKTCRGELNHMNAEAMIHIVVHPIQSNIEHFHIVHCDEYELKLTPVKLYDNISNDIERHQIIFVGFIYRLRMNNKDYWSKLLDVVLRGITACRNSEIYKMQDPDRPTIQEAFACMNYNWIVEYEDAGRIVKQEVPCVNNAEQGQKPIIVSYPLVDKVVNMRRTEARYGFQNPDIYEDDTRNCSDPILHHIHYQQDTNNGENQLVDVKPDSCSNHMTMSFSGAWTFIQPPHRHCPPRMPSVVSCIASEWSNWLIYGKMAITARLYDPLKIIGDWEDVTGRSINGLDQANGLGAYREDTETSCNSSIEEEGSIEAYPLHPVRPIRFVTLDIDLRWPYKLAFKYIAWHLGVDYEYLSLHLKNPMSGDNMWTCNRQSVTLPRLKEIPCMQVENGTNYMNFSVLPRRDLDLIHLNKLTRKRNQIVKVYNRRVECVGAVMVDISHDETVGCLIDMVKSGINKKMIERGLDMTWEYRLVEARGSRFKVYSAEMKLHHISQICISNLFNVHLRIEPVPSEIDGFDLPNRIAVTIFQAEDSNYFGAPFQIFASENETVADVRNRIGNKTGLDRECLKKWRFYKIDALDRRTSFIRDDNVMQTLSDAKEIYLLAEHIYPFGDGRRRRRCHSILF